MTSLPSLFSPPGKMHGTSLLICGMTAEPAVLSMALQSFTGEVAEAHAANGRLVGLLLLDASQPLLAPDDVPGLMHFAPPLAERWKKRTSLLHAKVALLGFSDVPRGKPKCFRLVVSTGNWTSESFGVDKQIDMVWSTDADVGSKSGAIGDCGEAFDFFWRLLVDLFELDAAKLPPALAWLSSWRLLLPKFNGKKRFVHSLDKALLGQIEKRFEGAHYGTVVCGSGFFEQGEVGVDPKVFSKLDKKLTRRKDRRVVLNAARAGAIADWFRREATRGWRACAPVDPLRARGGRTFLHAKYIAAIAGGDTRGHRIILMYLGSGNLSIQGILSRAVLVTGASPKVGNVEAGVVFAPSKSSEDAFLALACGRDYRPAELKTMVSGDPEEQHLPRDGPPIRWFRQSSTGWRAEFTAGDDAAEYCLDEAWVRIDAQSGLPDLASVQSLRVRRAAEGSEFLVPVFGSDGSFCRGRPLPLSPESVLQAISDFPRSPVADVDGGDDDDNDDVGHEKRASRRPQRPRRSVYPVKWLAALIEGIARQHDALRVDQYPVWFSHLELLLCNQLHEQDRRIVEQLQINPFSVLLEEGFRPPELDDDTRPSYEALIARIENVWFGSKARPRATVRAHSPLEGVV